MVRRPCTAGLRRRGAIVAGELNVERMTLREAAERTSRSITTLRRYIRSGRLHAEKRYGRFGPEYFVSGQDLADAGLDPDQSAPEQALERTAPARRDLARAEDSAFGSHWLREIVPLSLFQELQMKHEQLLVQYGMVRARGLRSMELRADLEAKTKELQEVDVSIERANKQHATEIYRLKQQLREAVLELEGRRMEIDALQEKVRALEMMTRNAVTNETIDNQLQRIREQSQRIEKMAAGSEKDGAPSPTAWRPKPGGDQPDH